MELIIPISDDAFRPKVRACINGYLGISENYSLTFGLYRKGVASANVHYLAKMLYSEMKINKVNYGLK